MSERASHETYEVPPLSPEVKQLVADLSKGRPMPLAKDRPAPEIPADFRPLRDRILIRRVDLPERIGLIWIPEKCQNPMQVGVVVAVGTGPNDEHGRIDPPECAVGDVVLYTGAWQGEDIKRGDRRFRTLERYQLAGIIEGVVDPDKLSVLIRHLG